MKERQKNKQMKKQKDTDKMKRLPYLGPDLIWSVVLNLWKI